MYLRTPKRYQPQKRRVHMFSMRWLWLWILTPIVAGVGYLIYSNADTIGPQIRDVVSETVNRAGGGFATMIAPTPLPTSDPTERLAAADNLWSQGSIEEALNGYETLLVNAPNDVRSHYRYTYGLIMESRNEEALAASEHALNANPFSADVWAIRSWALSRNGRYAEAITAGLQALSLDPNHAAAMAFIGEAYLDAGQPALAEERINQALQADPESPEAYFARGRWNTDANFDNPSARSDFDMAASLAPNLPNALIERSWADWRLNNYDVGLDTLEQVVEINPTNLDALYALAYFQYNVYGDPNQASDYLSRCLVADPENVSCLGYMGTVMVGTGNQQGAAENYQRIINQGTTNPVHYLWAGRTYANMGACGSATPLLRQGLALEQEQDVPNVDRLAAFETFLLQCGAPLNPQFADPITPEPTGESLLEPLGDGA